MDIIKNSESKRLEIKRPIDALKRFKFAIKVEPEYIISDDGNDHEIEGNSVYCLCGGPTWLSEVELGRITDSDSIKPKLDSSNWIQDLFILFEASSDWNNPQLKDQARRLAACWYHVATLVSFEKIEEEEVNFDRNEIMSYLLGSMSLPKQEEEDQDGEDQDGEDQERNDQENLNDPKTNNKHRTKIKHLIN